LDLSELCSGIVMNLPAFNDAPFALFVFKGIFDGETTRSLLEFRF
jgi:hypothetical protein